MENSINLLNILQKLTFNNASKLKHFIVKHSSIISTLLASEHFKDFYLQWFKYLCLS